MHVTRRPSARAEESSSVASGLRHLRALVVITRRASPQGDQPQEKARQASPAARRSDPMDLVDLLFIVDPFLVIAGLALGAMGIAVAVKRPELVKGAFTPPDRERRELGGFFRFVRAVLWLIVTRSARRCGRSMTSDRGPSARALVAMTEALRCCGSRASSRASWPSVSTGWQSGAASSRGPPWAGPLSRSHHRPDQCHPRNPVRHLLRTAASRSSAAGPAHPRVAAQRSAVTDRNSPTVLT